MRWIRPLLRPPERRYGQSMNGWHIELTLSDQVRGGLTFREGHYICEAIHETGLLIGFDLMVCGTNLSYVEVAVDTIGYNSIGGKPWSC